MVRIRDVAWALTATAVLAGSRPASATPITFTGNVANDFTTANNSALAPIGMTMGGTFQYTSGPDWVAGANGTSPSQLVGGADMKNVWFNYNTATDTMYVGIQGFKNAAGQNEILGDISGNPNPLQDTNSNPALGPISSPTNTFMGLKSIALAFAPIAQNGSGQPTMGQPTIIAGVPAIKPATTAPDFMVAHYATSGSGLPFSFGSQIANGGSLAFNTTAATPDFEFTINNFSKVSGITPSNGFYIEGFNGMAGGSAGKSAFQWMQAPRVPQTITVPPAVPEPTTWLAWMLMAGGAGWRYRRRLVGRD